MSKAKILIIGAAILVAAAILAFVTTSGDDDSEGTANNEEQSQQTQTPSGQNFSPTDMAGVDFVATVEGEQDGESYQMTLEYDGEGNSRIVGTQDGTRFESVFTSEAFYSCEDDNCIRFPITQSQGAPFQPDEFVFAENDLQEFHNNTVYRGQETCPAGNCDVWEVTDEDGSTSTLYIDSNQRISQVRGGDGANMVTITYEYRDVSIEIPANAQEVPTFEQ